MYLKDIFANEECRTAKLTIHKNYKCLLYMRPCFSNIHCSNKTTLFTYLTWAKGIYFIPLMVFIQEDETCVT